MKPLAAYNNGGYRVTLYHDGTKVRESLEGQSPKAVHPESIDVKITNYCDMGCPYCHETSTVEGKHGDLIRLLGILGPLPAGVELAIGGGNPLSHIALVPFLILLKERGIVANLTVNQGHLTRYGELLEFLLKNELVRGLGISIMGSNFTSISPLVNLSKNIVFHVIAGVNDPGVVTNLNELFPDSKTLVLGYKTFGKGVDFIENRSCTVESNIKRWNVAIPQLLGKVHLSFDNLAIEQLGIKRLFTEEGWNQFYMGDDGSFTMYVDAVEGTFAKTSRSHDRIPVTDTDLISFFNSLT